MAGRVVRRLAATVLVFAGAAAVLAAVVWGPERLYPDRTAGEIDDLDGLERIEAQDGRTDAQNDARSLLVQVAGGVAVLLGVAATWRQLRQSAEDSRQQRSSDKEIRWLDQYNKATTQLGDSNPSVRTAAVFSLQLLAEWAPSYRRAIAETLTAFVRTQSPWPPRPNGAMPSETTPIDDLAELRICAPEVQAAMTVLGEHTHNWYSEAHFRFRRTDLRRVNLAGGRLHRAVLTLAHLERAYMPDVHLDGASLKGANLRNADLPRAGLLRANIRGTNFDGADITDAHLEKATFDSTTTWPAGFSSADAIARGAKEVPADSPPTTGGPVEVAVE